MSRLTRGWREYLLEAFSGQADGVPDWVRELADGDDEGFFGRGSAVWAVNGGVPVIVAGVRALLVQTLHPGAMAGVHDWSRYREDPLGRLAGTVRWVLTTTFASRDAAEQASAFVSRIHTRVAGTYLTPAGASVHYSAADPELLRWVHVVFTDAFLTCDTTWSSGIPGGPNAYVREWAKAGELMGVVDPPRSEAELRSQLAAFTPVLVGDARVADAVRFIRKPPLARSVMPGYRIVFAGAVATLPDEYLRMLGLRRPRWPAIAATRVVLRVLAAVLGRPSSSEVEARRRIERLGL